MSEEQSFLDALTANPDDDTTRLVYADWLDERGDAVRAAYLRSVAQFAGRPSTEPTDPGVREFCAASDSIDVAWRQVVGSRFDLELTVVGRTGLIPSIKRVREQFGCWLGTAKRLVETAPTPLDSWVCIESARIRHEQLTRNPSPRESATIYTIRPSRLPFAGERAEVYDLLLYCQNGLVVPRPQPLQPPVPHPAVGIAAELLQCSTDEAMTRLQAGPLRVGHKLPPGEVMKELLRLRARLRQYEPVPTGGIHVVPSPTE